MITGFDCIWIQWSYNLYFDFPIEILIESIISFSASLYIYTFLIMFWKLYSIVTLWRLLPVWVSLLLTQSSWFNVIPFNLQYLFSSLAFVLLMFIFYCVCITAWIYRQCRVYLLGALFKILWFCSYNKAMKRVNSEYGKNLLKIERLNWEWYYWHFFLMAIRCSCVAENLNDTISVFLQIYRYLDGLCLFNMAFSQFDFIATNTSCLMFCYYCKILLYG